jgi:xylose isomerase
MYQNIQESVAGLCKYEASKGGPLRIAFEPEPNEGHPAMLIPTVASAIVFWRKVGGRNSASPWQTRASTRSSATRR